MRQISLKPLLLATLIITMCSGRIMAQDMNYWNLKYGTRNDLLGGAVVGSFLDLGVTYYNPGALMMIEGSEALLSGQAFEYQSIRLESDLPIAQDLSSSMFDTSPTLFAGLFPSKWLPGQLAYSALTRQRLKARLTSRLIEGDLSGDPVGRGGFSAEALFEQDMSENWYGATWANKIRDHVGIGVSMYGVYRGQRTRVEASVSVVDTVDSGTTLIAIDEFDYKTFRFVWKVGLALDFSPLTVGVTVTTPSLAFLGSGSAYFNRSVNGVDLDGNDTPDAFLVAEEQKDLSAYYKNPLSIAVGASHRWERYAIHVAAEWFNGVDKFDVLDTTNLPRDFPGASLTERVTQELGSVFNIGAGVEYSFNENVDGFASFVTDNSAAVPGSDARVSVSNWDIYHLTTGAAIVIYGLDLTLGIEYAFGSAPHEPTFDFVEDIIGESLKTTTIYRDWKAIVGFSFTL